MTESDESTKHLQFPLKIEWPNRKSFGFDEDDSDERPDSGVGESVRIAILRCKFFKSLLEFFFFLEERFTIHGRIVSHEGIIKITIGAGQ